ncbi:hypothetical protein AMAG_20446 [Allomyces macrogynus ATCC 38327]|uniref:Uncharacterized protein n=1 Tax=Allomyces macrogynus (strain ATCC 38327) TaxID=578462 RepID=A0A0L0TAE7_ALLM3|nr:hypothetical protein AMAG_20446 [Allomyces macrogynus ATCC 38327]|eukprot:KNE71793.1 hypothetical protein AMAG_20446 [Allomyces macrogynus ATCC 38327]
MADPTSTSSAVAKRPPMALPSKLAFAKWAVVATVANAAVDVTAADLSSLRALIMLAVRVVLMAALGSVLGDRRDQLSSLSSSPSSSTTNMRPLPSTTAAARPARVEFAPAHVEVAPVSVSVSPRPAPSKSSPTAPSSGHTRTDSGIDMSEDLADLDTTIDATDVPPARARGGGLVPTPPPARITTVASLPRTTAPASLPRQQRTSWPRTSRPTSTASALIAPTSPCPSLHPSVPVEVLVTPPAVPAMAVRRRGSTRKWATVMRAPIAEVAAPVPAWRQWVARWRGKVGRVLRRPGGAGAGAGVGVKRKRAGSRVGGMSRGCRIKGKGMKRLGSAVQRSWMPESMTVMGKSGMGQRGLVSRMRRAGSLIE